MFPNRKNILRVAGSLLSISLAFGLTACSGSSKGSPIETKQPKTEPDPFETTYFKDGTAVIGLRSYSYNNPSVAYFGATCLAGDLVLSRVFNRHDKFEVDEYAAVSTSRGNEVCADNFIAPGELDHAKNPLK